MKQNFNTMGVINLTPNSFSDGGLYNNYETFQKKFFEIIKWADIIDLGAESTAPFNDAVEIQEELSRFEQLLFPLIENHKDPHTTLSIDTYKPVVFETVAKKINSQWPNTHLIWNDVSGVVDNDLTALLKSSLNFSYVLSHNLCDTRENTTNHMLYLDHSELIQSMENYFNLNLSKIDSNKKILLDPCFGFSKTREQNHYLLKNFSKLANKFLDYSWVYGISRKSFLRFPQNLDSKNPENHSQLDQIQHYFLVDTLLKVNPNKLIFRIHDQKSLNALDSTLSILN